jgi:hypothetical protein
VQQVSFHLLVHETRSDVSLHQTRVVADRWLGQTSASIGLGRQGVKVEHVTGLGWDIGIQMRTVEDVNTAVVGADPIAVLVVRLDRPMDSSATVDFLVADMEIRRKGTGAAAQD